MLRFVTRAKQVTAAASKSHSFKVWTLLGETWVEPKAGEMLNLRQIIACRRKDNTLLFDSTWQSGTSGVSTGYTYSYWYKDVEEAEQYYNKIKIHFDSSQL